MGQQNVSVTFKNFPCNDRTDYDNKASLQTNYSSLLHTFSNRWTYLSNCGWAEKSNGRLVANEFYRKAPLSHNFHCITVRFYSLSLWTGLVITNLWASRVGSWCIMFPSCWFISVAVSSSGKCWARGKSNNKAYFPTKETYLLSMSRKF